MIIAIILAIIIAIFSPVLCPAFYFTLDKVLFQFYTLDIPYRGIEYRRLLCYNVWMLTLSKSVLEKSKVKLEEYKKWLRPTSLAKIY